MARFVLPVFLGLVHLTLSAPTGYNSTTEQTSGRRIGNCFGISGQNLTYDYIVVGGGTAGLTVAERLSENPYISVAVIEAGGFYEFENGNLSVPLYDIIFQTLDSDSQSLVDWGYTTEPQKGYNNRKINYPQGKTFGGSSALNFMIYHRATVGTFKWWADLVGDKSWQWNNVFSFYKKSPQFTPPDFQKIGPGFDLPFDSNAFSSQGGPLQVSFANYQQPVGPLFANGMKAAGIKRQNGLNSGQLNGYATSTVCVDPKSATRSSSEASFLQTAFKKTGLKVYPRTLAKKILFDADKKATGVDVETRGKKYTLSAKREIIVSSGAFNSPQLLMVSGIGPAATLKANNIPVVSTLEGVGQNLWDQAFFMLIQKVNVTTSSQIFNNPDFKARAFESYLKDRSGPLTSVSGDLIGWEKVPEPNRRKLCNSTIAQLAQFPSDWPEVEYLPAGIAFPPNGSASTDNYMFFGAALLTPISRGSVTITSPDTSVKPVINPNWLSEKADQEVAVQAFRRVREIAGQSGIVVEESDPGPNVQSDADVLRWIQENGSLIYHASATCAMGKDNDPKAVLDSKARVRGVTGLRVVDASSFPFLPPGHPSAVVYMLAEKIANDILTGS